MPQWTIYKNDQRTGQAITWHKALETLTRQEALSAYSIFHCYGYIRIETNPETSTRYRIIKEQ